MGLKKESNVENEELDQTNDLELASPGKKLKAIREKLGLTEAELASSLHMTVRYIKAIETDQHDILPGKTFVKGYIKSYAVYVNANIEEIMTSYDELTKSLEETVKSEAKVIRAKKNFDQNKRWLICAAIIIGLVIGLSWWFK